MPSRYARLPFRLKVETIIVVGIGTALLILMGVGLIADRALNRLLLTTHSVSNTQLVVQSLSHASAALKDAHRGERGYVITGDSLFLEPYEVARRRLPAELAQVQALTRENARQVQRVDSLNQLVRYGLALLDSVIRVRRDEGFEAAQQVVARGVITRVLAQADSTIIRMEDEERSLIRSYLIRSQTRAGFTHKIVLFGSAIAVLFLLSAGLVIFADVKQRRRTEAQLGASRRRFESLIETAGVVILGFDENLVLTEFNREAERIFGRGRADVLGLTSSRLFEGHNGLAVLSPVLERAAEGEPTLDFDAPVTRSDGEEFVVLWNINTLEAEGDGSGGVLAVGHDITPRKRMEERLRYDATHDALTSLLNRRGLLEVISELLQKPASERNASIMYIDLDRFKEVNDGLGHQCGDEVLIQTSLRLGRRTRHSDVLARIGGDEFAILLDPLDDPREAETISRRVLEHMARPFFVDGQEVFVSASIGIARIDDGHTSPEEVLRDVDIAMYHAKASAERRVVSFESGMALRMRAKQLLESDLHHALEGNQFVLCYQPIVHLSNGDVAGFEALLRWKHPQRGLLSPSEFIPIAEETGLILPIGEWVLREAISQRKRWRDVSDDLLIMLSVNFTREQFLHPDARNQLSKLLSEAQLDPGTLVLEITEKVLEKHAEPILEEIPLFGALGVQLCLDDFGTGYSSLHLMRRLPVEQIKIDRSFTRDMHASEAGMEMIRTIVGMAHRLETKVIVEGIETPDQLRALRDLGCEFGQGFLFARPLDPEAVTRCLVEDPEWKKYWVNG